MLPFIDANADDVHVLAERDGYLFFPRLLPTSVVLELRARALDIAADLGWLAQGSPRLAAVSTPGLGLGAYDDPRWITFLQRLLPDPLFSALRDHPALIQTLTRVLGRAPRAERGDLCRVVSGDGDERATRPHQDRFYISGEGELWTAWLPLGDCPVEPGALALLPGSHRRGLLPHSGEPMKQAITLPPDTRWHSQDLAAGDVLFFSGLTVHCALPSERAPRFRLSVDFRYA